MSERDRSISQIKANSGGPSSLITNVATSSSSTSLSGARLDRENRDQRSKSINNDVYGCGGNDSDSYRPSRSRASSNSGHSDEIIYKMAPEAVDPAILSRGSLSHRRYTRSALLLLRDEGKSKLRPRCYNEPRVSSLSLWKTDGNYVHHNCVTSNGDRDRDRACIIDQRNNRQSGVGLRDERGNSGNNSNQANPKNYDHRSISSSHLMPAFAKRRIVGSSQSGQNNNAGSISTNNGSNNTGTSGDPKERLKKDPQGSSLDNSQVVLSPQRKSMHLGCQMPPPTVNTGGNGGNHHSDREHAPARERRIGSGRLLPREGNWVDYRSTTTGEKDAVVENDTNYKYSRSTSIGGRYDYRGTEGGGNSNTGGNQSGRPMIERDQDHRNSNEYRSERYERRSYGRDFDRDSRGGGDNPSYSRRYITDNLGSSHGSGQPGGGSHYNDHRRRQYSDNRHNDEPEWFSGGPTSQHDTIELRGFDEPEESTSSCYKSDDGQSACGGAGTNGQRRVSESSSQTSTNTNVRHSTHNMNEAASIDDDVVVVNSTSPPPARSTPTKLISDSNNNNKDQQLQYGNDISSRSTDRATKQNPLHNSFENIGDDISDEDGSVNGKDGKVLEFNFDAFMNVDPLNNLLGVESKDDCVPGSRFSRWFSKQESERLSRQQNSANDKCQRTSVHEDIDLNEMSDKYFAPISPASASNNNTNTQNNQQQQPNMLMEFLQRGKFNTVSTASNNFRNNATSSGINVDNMPPIAILGAGKLYSDKSKPAGIIPSVEELEARMRKSTDGEIQSTLSVHGIGQLQNPLNHLQPANQQSQIGRFGTAVPNKIIQHQQPPQQQDMEAFKKLLEQLVPGSSGSNKSNTNAQTLQFPQVVSSSHRQTKQQSQFGSIPTPAVTTNSSKTDVLTNYIQQQQLFQQQRQQNIRSQLTRNEILSKPEAQYILQGVARGDFTYQSLLQQFNGPQVGSRAHEVIGAVLNHLSSTNSRVSSPSLMIGSQQVLSPVPQQISVGVVGTQQGSQSGSNNSASGLTQRIPSPRELQFHTQSIMQSALIKKKLEEQQENYRRRQEIQKHITPNNQAAVLPPGILQSSQQQLTNPGNAQTDVLGRGHEFVVGQRNSPPPLNSRQLQLQQQIQMQQMGKLSTATFPHPLGTNAVGSANGLVDGDVRNSEFVMGQQSSPPPLNMRQLQLQHHLQTQQQMRKHSASQLALTGAVGSGSGQIDDDGRNNDFVVSQQNSPPPLNSRQLQLQLQIQLQQQIRKQTTASQQHQAGTSNSGVHQRQINSPTPLAFTPTSVLRKMTAEKDNFQATSTESGKTFPAVNKTTIQNMVIQSQRQKITSPPQSQPRMILGGGNQQQLSLSQVHHTTQLSQANNSCNQQNSTQSVGSGTSNLRNNPMKWNSAINQQVQPNKPLGRPILKGGPSSIPSSCSGVPVSQSQQQQPLSPQIIQQQPQMVFASKIEFQQMQQQRQRNKNATSQQSQSKQQPSPVSQQSQQNSQQQILFMSQLQQQQQQQQLTQFMQQRQQQQQQRAVLQRAQYQQMQQQLQQQSNSVAGGKPAANQVQSENNLNNPNSSNHNNGGAIINYQRDGGLSPTSNQLARWFSPELLAQASAGKLPSLNMGQALSLEEFERSIQHSSAAVHN